MHKLEPVLNFNSPQQVAEPWPHMRRRRRDRRTGLTFSNRRILVSSKCWISTLLTDIKMPRQSLATVRLLILLVKEYRMIIIYIFSSDAFLHDELCRCVHEQGHQHLPEPGWLVWHPSIRGADHEQLHVRLPPV